MRFLCGGSVLMVLMALAGCTAHPAPAGADSAAGERAGATATASAALARLAEDWWETSMAESPTWATYLGDFRYNDRLEESGPESRARRAGELHAFDARLRALDRAALTVEGDRILADLLARKIALELEEPTHKFYQWRLDQMDGPQARFFQLVNFHPFKTAEDFADFAARLEAFPRSMAQYLDDLRAGVAEGRVATKVVAARVRDQLDALLAKPPAACVLHAAVDKLPADLPERAALAARLERAIAEHVYGAFRTMREFVVSEALPHARDTDGLWALPGGAAAYRYRIREHTTLDLTPEELHQTGLDELKTLAARMTEIARRRGHTGDLPSFFAAVRRDPANFCRTRAELLAGFTAILARANAKLPRYFLRLPAIGCEVREMEAYREKDSVAAFYYGPPEDGSRPGIFYANLYDLPARPRCNMTALTVHEAVPGHHLQIAFALEQRELPKLRRHEGFTAFVEGWALYAEVLADEMGMYEDDLSRFGMLTYQAWRAARLVVDTGLHAFRWTRQQAIDFMRAHVALSDTEIINEIDRYIIWPGQALAYKVGQREILALRAEAERRLGGRFDLREFHDVVLRNGAVPLTTLRALVTAWIVAREGPEAR
ncbi:MAG: DUF885 domain-containing protein [Planctomycetes bacterium]|nr:DUF885 domain-containing protein [Planctomycetota bacterium]